MQHLKRKINPVKISKHYMRMDQNLKMTERELKKAWMIKAMFKKCGFTTLGILIAVCTTIGVVVCSITNALKEVANRLGKKAGIDRKKFATLLPGLLKAIISFLFCTTSQLIAFFGTHSCWCWPWLPFWSSVSNSTLEDEAPGRKSWQAPHDQSDFVLVMRHLVHLVAWWHRSSTSWH